ncbi:MAG: hypothetical protein R3211_05485 [Balneolaceae bacterium]|nr:hypothetical protein [Balneolaceae bacterium]
MGLYLLLFSTLVVVLFLVGVFYTIREFQEMKANPDEYREEPKKVDTVE